MVGFEADANGACAVSEAGVERTLLPLLLLNLTSYLLKYALFFTTLTNPWGENGQSIDVTKLAKIKKCNTITTNACQPCYELRDIDGVI